MERAERIAEELYELLREKKARSLFPTYWLPTWLDLPSLSKRQLTDLIRESIRLAGDPPDFS